MLDLFVRFLDPLRFDPLRSDPLRSDPLRSLLLDLLRVGILI